MKRSVPAHLDALAALLARGRAVALALPAVALMAIFLLDLGQPVPVVFSILYVAPIALTARLGQPRATYMTFVVSSVATVAAAAFGSVPDDRTAALINRALALVVQVLAAAVVIQQLETRERERRATREQEDRVEAMHREARQKDAFLAMATHEIRGPLSTLRGYAQLIQAGAGRAGVATLAESAARILRQVDRLARLVGDLTDLSRIQIEEFEVRREPLDLETLLREAAQAQWVAQADRVIELHPEGAGLMLEADAPRLLQVLGNLLENAVKYSPRDTPVRIRFWAEGGMVHVTVSDAGIGIPPAEQARLFERFYRGRTGARNAGGLGAGLYICRSIVEAHGGRIWVESTPGHGTTVGFTLPLR